MNQKVQRIYTPFTQNQCVATPYVLIDGKETSFQPLPEGSLEIELIDEVKRSRVGVYDESYSLTAKEMPGGQEGQIEMTVLIPDEATNPDKSTVKIGLLANSLPFMLDGGVQEAALKIGGTFDEKTLDYFGKLADIGNCLMITGIHFDADDDKHYASRMTLRSFEHDGTNAGDTSLLYPRSMSNDEQTTIRSMSGLNLKLDGFSYLEMPVYKGVQVNLTITTKFFKRS